MCTGHVGKSGFGFKNKLDNFYRLYPPMSIILPVGQIRIASGNAIHAHAYGVQVACCSRHVSLMNMLTIPVIAVAVANALQLSASAELCHQRHLPMPYSNQCEAIELCVRHLINNIFDCRLP